MKKLGLSAVAVLAFALTGCAVAAPEPTPAPTETNNPNASACEDFAALTMTVPDVVNSDESNAWDDLRLSFDRVALSGEGTVKERMLALSEDWPDYADIALWNDVDTINEKISAVERACNSEGIDEDFAQFTTG